MGKKGKIKGKLQKLGFDIKQVKIEPDHWQLGTIAPQIVKPDGDWSKHLPVYEAQYNNNFDSYGCTCFGTLNQCEIFLNFLEGKEYNFAERYHYNLVGIEPPGANPHDVYQSIRHNGMLAQEELPFSSTLKEFKAPRPMTEELLSKGKLWLNDYTLEHEWLTAPTHEDIAASLKYSPVAISVTAWFEQNGLYVDNGQPNTHWCVCFKEEKGVLWIFDSYDNSVKKLHPSHKISLAKKISVKKNFTELSTYKTGNHYLELLKKVCLFLWDIITLKWI